MIVLARSQIFVIVTLFASEGFLSKILKVLSGGLFSDANVNGEGEGWSSKTYMDIDNHKDPQMCSAYAADIYRHLRVAEVRVCFGILYVLKTKG